jgi:hypothetical protein
MGHDDQIHSSRRRRSFPQVRNLAVVQGDPTRRRRDLHVRLRFLTATSFHRHGIRPTRHVTALIAAVGTGLGEDFDASGLVAHKEDGFVTAPANMAHFASARGVTEVQVHAIGPFQLTYVHPQDDPTK